MVWPTVPTEKGGPAVYNVSVTFGLITKIVDFVPHGMIMT